MRFLIHVLGDIHQPLHASTLVNEKFLKGDFGGNLFLLNFKDGISNLHKLYDSGADKLGKELKRVKLIFLILALNSRIKKLFKIFSKRIY